MVNLKERKLKELSKMFPGMRRWIGSMLMEYTMHMACLITYDPWLSKCRERKSLQSCQLFATPWCFSYGIGSFFCVRYPRNIKFFSSCLQYGFPSVIGAFTYFSRWRRAPIYPDVTKDVDYDWYWGNNENYFKINDMYFKQFRTACIHAAREREFDMYKLMSSAMKE